LCIEQSNLAEKSIQIPRMFQIYGKASSVLVWPGPESDNSALALEALEKLGSVPDDMEVDDMHDNMFTGSRLSIRPKDPSRLQSFSDLSASERSAITDLLTHRTWWSRIWVIQEISHACQAYLICGSRAVNWDIVSNIFRINESFANSLEYFDAGTFTNAFMLDLDRQISQVNYNMSSHEA
jgi:hypothetical protein